MAVAKKKAKAMVDGYVHSLRYTNAKGASKKHIRYCLGDMKTWTESLANDTGHTIRKREKDWDILEEGLWVEVCSSGSRRHRWKGKITHKQKPYDPYIRIEFYPYTLYEVSLDR